MWFCRKKIKIPQQTSKVQGPDRMFALFLVVIHIKVIPCIWGCSKSSSLSLVFLVEMTPNSHAYSRCLLVTWFEAGSETVESSIAMF